MSYLLATGPMPEYNIRQDIPDAQKLFASGVPIYMMPLDSTQIKLDEVKRGILFKMGTPFTDQLTLLYHELGQVTPTLYDAMAVAYVIKPDLCPVEQMHIVVDDKGYLGVSLGRRMLMSACIRAQMTFFHFSFHDFRRQDNSDAGALMGDNWQDKLPTWMFNMSTILWKSRIRWSKL